MYIAAVSPPEFEQPGEAACHFYLRDYLDVEPDQQIVFISHDARELEFVDRLAARFEKEFQVVAGSGADSGLTSQLSEGLPAENIRVIIAISMGTFPTFVVQDIVLAQENLIPVIAVDPSTQMDPDYPAVFRALYANRGVIQLNPEDPQSGIEQIYGRVRNLHEFSVTVRNIWRDLVEEPVTASRITNRLQESHPEYVGGKFEKAQFDADRGERWTIDDWLQRVGRLYDIDDVRNSKHQVLDGQLLLAGLIKLDEHVRTALDDGEFIERLFKEIEVKPRDPPQPVEQQSSAEPGQGTEHVQSSDSAEPEKDETVQWTGDEPAREDQLRRRPIARVIANKLTDLRSEKNTESFMMLLDGPWGSGKSTILGFVQDDLCPPKKDEKTQAAENGTSPAEEEPGERPRSDKCEDWTIVHFDAWRQAHIGPAWWALLSSLRLSIRKKLGHSTRLRLWLSEKQRILAPDQGALWLLAVLAVAWLVVAASIPDLSILPRASSLNKLAQLAATIGSLLTLALTLAMGTLRTVSWSSPRGARIYQDTRANPMSDLAGHFDWLASKTPDPVVFMIDNLDRCPQPFVVELLDAIQTLVRNELQTNGKKAKPAKLFFIVASDGRWLQRCYEIEHSELAVAIDEPGRSLGHLFLDKIFQLTVPVPIMGKQLQQSFFMQLLSRPENGNDQSADENEEHQQELEKAEQEVRQGSGQRTILQTFDGASARVKEEIAPLVVERLLSEEIERSTEHALAEYSHLLDQNARSMKRFTMAYEVMRAVRTLEGQSVSIDALARWNILRIRWPELAASIRGGSDSLIKGEAMPLNDGLKTLLISGEVRRVLGDLSSEDIVAAAGATDEFGVGRTSDRSR